MPGSKITRTIGAMTVIGVVERRKVVVATDVDGEHAITYAKDKRGKIWKWDPTKGVWRASRKWPTTNYVTEEA